MALTTYRSPPPTESFRGSSELYSLYPMPAREEIMADETVRSALSWSGGKDSALTLSTLREQGVEPAALITQIPSWTLVLYAETARMPMGL